MVTEIPDEEMLLIIRNDVRIIENREAMERIVGPVNIQLLKEYRYDED